MRATEQAEALSQAKGWQSDTQCRCEHSEAASPRFLAEFTLSEAKVLGMTLRLGSGQAFQVILLRPLRFAPRNDTSFNGLALGDSLALPLIELLDKRDIIGAADDHRHTLVIL